MALKGRRESELSRPPVVHLFMHQKVADALLLGELQTSNQYSFCSVVAACVWGVGYYILHLGRILVIQLRDNTVKFRRIQRDV